MTKPRRQHRVHGQPTGRVWIRDFDLGMVRTLGGVTHPDPMINEFVVQIPNLPEGADLVPVLGKKNPEPSVIHSRIPRLVISRDSAEPEKSRIHPFTEEFRVASGQDVSVQDPAHPPGVLIDGSTRYCTKEQADPFDITYTIEVWHRHENFVQPLLFHVLRTLRLQGAMYVTDSRGEQRSYNAFLESGPTDLSELLSLTDRSIGYAVTYRVTGELDHVGEQEFPSVRYPQVELTPR